MLFFWNRDELEPTLLPEELLRRKKKARLSDTHLTCKISWGNLYIFKYVPVSILSNYLIYNVFARDIIASEEKERTG